MFALRERGGAEWRGHGARVGIIAGATEDEGRAVDEECRCPLGGWLGCKVEPEPDP